MSQGSSPSRRGLLRERVAPGTWSLGRGGATGVSQGHTAGVGRGCLLLGWLQGRAQGLWPMGQQMNESGALENDVLLLVTPPVLDHSSDTNTMKEFLSENIQRAALCAGTT